MREILFRGKDEDINEWIYGQYDSEAQTIRRQGYRYPHAVIPETVGQFTGLIDKNNVKIFEGDILLGYKYPYRNNAEFNYYAEVVYFDDSPAFGIITRKNPLSKVNGISDGIADYMEEWNPNDWEIIGNIYDTPELLETEETT